MNNQVEQSCRASKEEFGILGEPDVNILVF